jgi:predicted RNase H-like HicB family nuclease
MKASDHFQRIATWSEEDACYIGTCPGLMHGGVHGDNESAVYAELCEVVEEWLQIYANDGQALPTVSAGIA